MLRIAVEQTSAAYSHLRKDRKTRLMSMSFACVSHSSDPLAAIAFSSWRVGGIVLFLVVVDSNVLEERTNEVSLVGGGLQSGKERAGCMPFWNSSLCASLVCAS